ncbi:hypothetical protein DFH07DRAFT_842893 [Mycena maculata]|uniref:F-box domain-containing protein n=1 Tax=Mycena maculata TaxID=230809 RepID=A0AAD7MX68_9AGAR|nr:hypothetical protein DFH07DRAFT_842893 [Mycena maculata]
MLSIPVEIASEIFIHCLPHDPPKPSASIAPMLLTAICQKWRYIALSDPRLWSTLTIDVAHGHHRDPQSTHYRLSTFVQEWLLRAGSMPLSVLIALPSQDRRWSDSVSSPWIFDQKPCFLPPSLFTESWDHLTSFWGDFFTFRECLKLLLHAPRLVRGEFRDMEEGNDDAPFTSVSLLRTGLTDLTFTIPSEFDLSNSLATLLDSLTLPQLRNLDVLCSSYCFNDTSPSMTSFLQRASHMRYFTARLHDGDYDVPHDDAVLVSLFTSIFGAMPELTTFSLHTDWDNNVFVILDLLKTSRAFLPCIQSITFYVTCSLAWSCGFTQHILDTLSSRSEPTSGVAQLLDFEFKFEWDNEWDEFEDEEEDDSLLIFRLWELKEKGMKIYLGPPSASWI